MAKEFDSKELLEEVWIFQECPESLTMGKPRLFAEMGENEISMVARTIASNGEEYEKIANLISSKIEAGSTRIDISSEDNGYILAICGIDDGLCWDRESEFDGEIKDEDKTEVYAGSTVYALMDWYGHNIEVLFSTDWNTDSKPFVIE